MWGLYFCSKYFGSVFLGCYFVGFYGNSCVLLIEMSFYLGWDDVNGFYIRVI